MSNLYSFWQRLTGNNAEVQDSWYTEREYRDPRVMGIKVKKHEAIKEILRMIGTVSTFNEELVEAQLKDLDKKHLTQIYNDWKEETETNYLVI